MIARFVHSYEIEVFGHKSQHVSLSNYLLNWSFGTTLKFLPNKNAKKFDQNNNNI